MSNKKLGFFRVTSAQNWLVKELKSLQKSQKVRDSLQKVALFDEKAIDDLKELPIERLFATQEKELLNRSAKEKVLLPLTLFQKISGMKVQKGIAAIYSTPKVEEKWPDRLIVLDGVSDPGNIGTLIRTAHAFDFGGFILLESCCDPFNDKALRAAKGHTLHFWMKKMKIDALISALKKEGYFVYVTDSEGKPLEKNPKGKLAIILGNEGSGVRESLKKFGERLAIPMQNHVDSLNVAVVGSILMYEIVYG